MVEKNTPGEELTEGAIAPETTIPEAEVSAENSPQANEEIIAILNRFAPGIDTSTPEAIIEGATKVLNSMVPIYDKVYDVALGSPEAASFVNDLLETGDVAKSLARNYDPDELQALWQEVTDDSNEEDRTMHSEKVSKAKQRNEMVQGNMDISFQNISSFMEKRKHWPPEKAEEFEQKVIKHYDDGADGLITEEDLAMLEKGFYHDDDVTEAEENGKAIGRNEQIKARKATQKEKENLLPDLNGGAVKPASAGEDESPFMSSLRQLADKKPILS